MPASAKSPRWAVPSRPVRCVVVVAIELRDFIFLSRRFLSADTDFFRPLFLLAARPTQSADRMALFLLLAAATTCVVARFAVGDVVTVAQLEAAAAAAAKTSATAANDANADFVARLQQLQQQQQQQQKKTSPIATSSVIGNKGAPFTRGQCVVSMVSPSNPAGSLSVFDERTLASVGVLDPQFGFGGERKGPALRSRRGAKQPTHLRSRSIISAKPT